MNELVELFQTRDSFAFRKFVKLMNFGTPVAINGFYAQWEECVDRYMFEFKAVELLTLN
jgi:hypothetical protein